MLLCLTERGTLGESVCIVTARQVRGMKAQRRDPRADILPFIGHQPCRGCMLPTQVSLHLGVWSDVTSNSSWDTRGPLSLAIHIANQFRLVIDNS